MDPSFPRFHLPEPIRRPVLTAEPSVYSRPLRSQDKFIIFASDGLWEHLSNQQAVEIVHNSPRAVRTFSMQQYGFFWYPILPLLQSSFACLPPLVHLPQGITRRLLKAALTEAARKREMRYADIQKLDKGVRRFFHDDITVVVVFLDHELLGEKMQAPELSIRGFVDAVGPSNFSILQGINANARSVL